MLKQYTIDELVEEVNRIIAERKGAVHNADGRLSEMVTVRKIRDLLTKRLISQPVKEGRQNYFDDNHVEQILSIKTLQKEGASEKLLRGLSSGSYLTTAEVQINTTQDMSNDSELKENAMNVLNAISNRTKGINDAQPVTASAFLAGVTGKSQPYGDSNSLSTRSTMESIIMGSSQEQKPEILKAGMNYMDSHKSGVKVFSEYPLDDTGRLFLKMEQGFTVTNKEETLKKIKQILGLGE
jgi:DNA-binding transcriptional MerR regulator